VKHGTHATYNSSCRCDACRGAHNAHQRDRYARTKHARLWATLDSARCGTRTQYLYGCRCQQCTKANREYMRRYRNRDDPQRFQQPWRDRRLRPPKANATLPPGTRLDARERRLLEELLGDGIRNDLGSGA
jgi:hypothetical protein